MSMELLPRAEPAAHLVALTLTLLDPPYLARPVARAFAGPRRAVERSSSPATAVVGHADKNREHLCLYTL